MQFVAGVSYMYSHIFVFLHVLTCTKVMKIVEEDLSLCHALAAAMQQHWPDLVVYIDTAAKQQVWPDTCLAR